MSDFRDSSSGSGRMSRRGFVVGLSLAGMAALVSCAGGAAAPATSTGSTAGGAAAPTASTGSTAGSTPASASNPTTITMTNDNKFSPSTLTVAKGATVTFDNSSTMVHSATDDPSKAVNKADAQLPDGAQPWDSGLIQPGQKWTHTFDVAGTYKFFCVPHETLGMLGTITVQ